MLWLLASIPCHLTLCHHGQPGYAFVILGGGGGGAAAKNPRPACARALRSLAAEARSVPGAPAQATLVPSLQTGRPRSKCAD